MWGELLERVHHPAETVRIAVVGKYIDLPDAYLSVTEALRAGGFGNNARVEIVWVASDDCTTYAGAPAALGDVQGVLIPGGFGVRGIEGKIGAINFARINKIPMLGLCLGPAVHRHRGGPEPGRTRRRELGRVRRQRRRPGDRDHGRPARGRRRRQGHGRHHAARRLPGAAGGGLAGRRDLRQPPAFPSGTGTGTRSTTPTGRRWRRPDCTCPGRRRIPRWSSSSSWTGSCTRSSWRPRRTRSSSPGRPGRTRCSRPSSGPRWTTWSPNGCRSPTTDARLDRSRLEELVAGTVAR